MAEVEYFKWCGLMIKMHLSIGHVHHHGIHIGTHCIPKNNTKCCSNNTSVLSNISHSRVIPWVVDLYIWTRLISCSNKVLPYVILWLKDQSCLNRVLPDVYLSLDFKHLIQRCSLCCLYRVLDFIKALHFLKFDEREKVRERFRFWAQKEMPFMEIY